jgi:hypothetical protein
MLAQAGHDVYAASGGFGRRKEKESGVTLIEQAARYVSKYEPFDLYIDSAWWEGKVPSVKAKKYIALKWSPENYTYNPLPPNFYLAYPYVSHHYNFNRNNFPNRDKTFALPTMFGDTFCKPNWEATKVFLPGKFPLNQGIEKYINVLASFLSKHPVEGTSKELFIKMFGGSINFKAPESKWVVSMPYNEVLESMRRCKISLPILNPGAIIEAAFMGVPSVFWARGGFFNPLAEMLGMSIEHEAPPERVTEVVELLMNDKKKYYEVVYTSQDYFSSHTYSGAIKYFNFMCENIGLPI